MEEMILCSQSTARSGWSLWGMVLYHCFGTGLCCWHIWHLATAVSMSSGWAEVHVVEPMCNLHLYYHGSTGIARERGCLSIVGRIVSLIIKLLTEVPFWWAFIWGTKVSLHPLTIWWALSIYLSPKCLSYQFSILLLQAPNCPANLWLQPMNQYRTTYLTILFASICITKMILNSYSNFFHYKSIVVLFTLILYSVFDVGLLRKSCFWSPRLWGFFPRPQGGSKCQI